MRFHDRKLGRTETKARESAKRFMKGADADKNGLVEPDEFTEFMRAQFDPEDEEEDMIYVIQKAFCHADFIQNQFKG